MALVLLKCVKSCGPIMKVSSFGPVSLVSGFRRQLTTQYVQGQISETDKDREYFYYLDHLGQLFLDDAKIKNFTSCFKEQKFLEFFFRGLKANQFKNQYQQEFPYVSLCGRERNYLRCDDLPFVVTELDVENDRVFLNKIKSEYWSHPFDPKNLCQDFSTGRLYYIFVKKNLQEINAGVEDGNKKQERKRVFEREPFGIALVKSDISINLMKSALTSSDSSHDGVITFNYKSKSYTLSAQDENRLEKFLKTRPKNV